MFGRPGTVLTAQFGSTHCRSLVLAPCQAKQSLIPSASKARPPIFNPMLSSLVVWNAHSAVPLCISPLGWKNMLLLVWGMDGNAKNPKKNDLYDGFKLRSRGSDKRPFKVYTRGHTLFLSHRPVSCKTLFTILIFIIKCNFCLSNAAVQRCLLFTPFRL